MAFGLLTTDSKEVSSSTAGTSTGSYLIPTTLFGELIRAMRKNLVLSGLAAKRIGPDSIPGSSIYITTQTPETIVVNRVEQGGEIPLDHEDYSGFNLRPIKYGVRIGITKEQIEDSAWDVMGLNVETAGYEFADNEESLIVAQLDAASTEASHNVANSNATLPVSDITAAMQNLEADNHIPSHLIIGVEVANDIRNIDSFHEADKSGGVSPQDRLIGTIYGMKVIVTNNVSSVLAYVIDARYSFIIAEKRPVTMQRYSDYSRDVEYGVVTQRIAVRYLRENATSEITTT